MSEYRYSFTNNILNTKVTTPTTNFVWIDTTKSTQVVLTANDGYFFTPSFEYQLKCSTVRGLLWLSKTVNVTAPSNTLTIPISASESAKANQNGTMAISGTVVKAVPITYNGSVLKNASLNGVAPTNLYAGQQVILNFVSAENATFKEAPTCTTSETSVIPTISNTDTTARIVIRVPSNQVGIFNIAYNVVAETQAQGLKYNLSDKTSNFTITKKPALITNNAQDNAFVLQANEGFTYIEKIPSMKISCVTSLGRYIVWYDKIAISNGDLYEFPDIVPTEQAKTATIQSVVIEGSAVAPTENHLQLPFTNIFSLTLEDFVVISDMRFMDRNSYVVDLLSFVSAIYQPIFPIETGDMETLILGWHNTQQKFPTIPNRYHTILTNQIEIPATLGSQADYANTDIKVYIPFVGYRDIPASITIGKTCYLQFVLDVATGNGIAEFYIDKCRILCEPCSMCYRIPVNSFNGSLEEYEHSIEGNEYIDMTPKILLYSPILLNEENANAENLVSCDFLATIKDISGYCAGELFNFHGVSAAIRKEEKEMVVSLIQDGIIVKNEAAKNP